ncbi:MAG: hypothetical protein JNM10_07895 [Planctomycetia bacterium]|nr:hypothetical protein [Planctomycetia bacterium]
MTDPRRPARAASRLGAATLFAVLAACGGGGGGGGGGTTEARDLASVTPDGASAAVNSGAGDFAADYLRRTNFTSLLVEVDYPVGRPPSPGVLQLLEDRLAERCDKPDGVHILLDDAIPLVEFPASVNVVDLDDLEAAHRDNFADLPTREAVLYILYVKGQSDLGGAGTQVLGLTYHGSSVALFVDAAQSSGFGVTTAEVEGTGLVHEAGHCLGLTGSTVPMLVDHRDELHGYHDVDEASVMYWIVSVPNVAPNLGDPDFAQFDANSVADLEAFGGLGPLPAFVGTPRVTSPDDLFPVATCRTCRQHRR